MQTLLCALLLVLPGVALAQSLPPMHTHGNSDISVTSPGPGVQNYADGHGNRSTTYDVSPGTRWYDTQNRDGTRSQGYLYDYSHKPVTPPTDNYVPLNRAYERLRER